METVTVIPHDVLLERRARRLEQLSRRLKALDLNEGEPEVLDAVGLRNRERLEDWRALRALVAQRARGETIVVPPALAARFNACVSLGGAR